VGDDSVIDAALRQHAAIRVDSLERMLTTASVLSRCDRPLGSRLIVAGISGGACDITADRAADEGLELIPLAASTVAALRAELPDFGHVQNPLDVTGGAVSDPTLFGRIIAILGTDPGADVVLVQQDVPTRNSGAVDSFRGTLAATAALEQPAFVTGSLSAPVIADDERFPTGRDRIIAGGLDMALFALGRGAWLARRVAPVDRHAESVEPPAAAPSTSAGAGVWSEARSRALLSEHAVPMVPAAHVGSRDEAVAAATRLGYPVVVKANADDLAHKTDVGAVELDLADDEAVRAALDRIDAALTPSGRQTDGYLVSPMRRRGTELIVGVARHDPWGLALAVGIGGVLTETHADASLRLLPVGRADVREMLGELQHHAVLQGGRGRPPADRDAVVDAVLAVADAAWRRRDQIEAIEVNPLLVDGAHVEALDALVEWRVSPDASGPR
jgi:acyl-CoA synthetase (NDP forming)